ncbi:MAG: B12-binding domain-containing radical SAM protein [Candidatus Omnitrophica bacterium]|nr:B12-binding domain-containing radical SAM protein [Candidatus Omnitrophota bacterium]
MKYEHALFVNPYVERSATSAMMLFPPTGLEYVATNARECVERVSLLDLRYEKELSYTEHLVDFIKRDVDFVGVGIGWDRQLDQIFDMINHFPKNVPVVVGGYTATERVLEIFNNCPGVDVVVRGEGEETIKELLNGVPYPEIKGISYRQHGQIIHNDHRPLPGVDAYTAPDRTLRHNDYRLTLNGINVANLNFDTVLTARGCPFNCKFCTFTLNPLGQKREYSARDVNSVLDEIEKIPASIVLFSDENVSIDPRRLEAICDGIIARGIKKKFMAQSRIELARNPALLEKMVKAGFKALLIGVESPHDRILKQLDKGFDSATVRAYFKVLTRYPIYYHGYFIYGNITETEEEMLYIAQFAKEIGVDSITFLKLRIEKFSLLRNLVEATPGYHIGTNGVVYSDQYPYDYLKKIGRKIKFSFYTPGRFIHILKKCHQIGFFTPKEYLSMLAMFPKVMAGVFAREIKRGRLFDSLKRTFIRNN